MKNFRYFRIAVILSLLIIAGTSAAFFSRQETRDFKIAKNLDIFFSLFRELNTFYVDEIEPDKIIRTGIDNMLNTLDPYTVFYPESDADEFAILTTGKYGGIGSLIRGGGEYVVISEVYKGFPADLAGIKAGDKIKAVDGVSLKGVSSEQVSDRLKGNPGTELTLTVLRKDEEKEFRVKRQRIAIPAVPYYGMTGSNTGYIRFSSFTQGCYQEVKNALLELKKNNPENIILDLRGNPGGILTEAVEIVNLFVGPGNNVVSTKGKVSQYDETFRTTRTAVDENIPLAVLINRSSASAAEIVAGAIQDLDRGIIVGQRSYGKGLVQVSRQLSYNAQLKVTTAKYYIPSGRCIQALDFSHRNEDGSVGYIPDSLISEFRTRNGRIVKDGGGITPDYQITPASLSQLTAELYLRNFIFDFATEYYWAHPDIKNSSDFVFTDSDYEGFRNMLLKDNFSYTTITETSLKELIGNAKKEKYYELHKDLFTKLEKEVTHNLDHDLRLFREEIQELIEEEILSRYFYDEGAIKWSLGKDEQVKKALELLNSPEKYGSILSGKPATIYISNSVNNNLNSISRETLSGKKLPV
ncbi:MAG TPA: S41 family peptidase [Bacteroidales bacterium]|nr:S41 family peptidase [Bacteroidales bacterium]HPR13315.1 S41 family peptidase [Bacteroidales bacterium]